MLDELIGAGIKYPKTVADLKSVIDMNEHYAIAVNNLLGKDFYHKHENAIVGFTKKGSIRLLAKETKDFIYQIVQCFSKDVLETE